MSIIEQELGGAFHGKIKRKGNSTGNLRSQAKRVASESTEVMVKVTGFGKGAAHVKAHLTYITRHGNVEMENDKGEVFDGKESVNRYFEDWAKDFEDSKRHKNQRDTMHMVLSMPENTDPESVRNAVREFAKANFSKNHEYVFALHTDEPHPHCHLTVKCLGFDGSRLNPRKADLQRWREGFADKLRDEGVDAEASPRSSRGVVKKAESNIVRHIEAGDKTHAPRVSKVRAKKISEAASELVAEAKGQTTEPKPWEDPIKKRQAAIRSAWLKAADALEKEETKITFNQKEAKNDRPDYERTTSGKLHRATALYQSNLEKHGQKAPPGTLASVRNLSRLGVVHDRRISKVLLRSDAPNRLGRNGSPDSQMRREGAGNTGTSGRGKQLTKAEENKALAEKIRGFVKAMPAVQTEREAMKSGLASKFAATKEKGAEQAAPKGKEKGPER